jgi:phosphoserine phosphatase
MLGQVLPSRIPEGMTCADETAFLHKIKSFAEAGGDNLHIVYDFDRTLTVSHPETQEDVTTWHILGKHLSEEGCVRYKNLFQKYRSLELADKLTERDAIEWWSASFQLYIDERVNIRHVDADFLARASIRPGAYELFALCKANKVPSVIMSAGIRDVIEIWTQKYGIEPALVLSTALKFDNEGVIVGWDKDTLVLSACPQ